MLTNIYVEIFGVMFATVWVQTSQDEAAPNETLATLEFATNVIRSNTESTRTASSNHCEEEKGDSTVSFRRMEQLPVGCTGSQLGVIENKYIR